MQLNCPWPLSFQCARRIKLKEIRMPTYVCSAAVGQLTPAQKAEIVNSITTIHHEETGAPRYLVLVIFHDLAPGNCYLGERPGAAEQSWIRGDIRSGRTNEQKSQMLRRIMHDVGRASGATEDAVWVYLSDLLLVGSSAPDIASNPNLIC